MTIFARASYNNYKYFENTMTIQPIERFFPPGTQNICSYGFGCCGYSGLAIQLRQMGSLYSLPNEVEEYIPVIVEPAEIPDEIFDFEDDDQKGEALAKKLTDNRLKTSFKRALINIVIENVKRTRCKKQIIPVCFCIDINNESLEWRPPQSPELLKKSENNELRYTCSELRQAYKLCYEPALGEEINQVARRTFEDYFAKVHIMPNRSICLEKRPPIWSGITQKSAELLVGPNHIRKPKDPHLKPQPDWRDVMVEHLTCSNRFLPPPRRQMNQEAVHLLKKARNNTNHNK